MQTRQEKIVLTALELFALHGFSGTSTAKIAKAAGVSEALIFKHFQTKKGLLGAIMHLAGEKIKPLLDTILEEKDARTAIHKVLAFPLKVMKEQGDFWKLMFSIKFSSPDIFGEDLCAQKNADMKSLYNKVVNALKEIKHPTPEQEAEVILLKMEGLGTTIMKTKNYEQDALIAYMQSQY